MIVVFCVTTPCSLEDVTSRLGILVCSTSYNYLSIQNWLINKLLLIRDKITARHAKNYGHWYKTDRCEIETQISKLIIRSQIYDDGILIQLFYFWTLFIVLFI
jgi:hypothetical protein